MVAFDMVGMSTDVKALLSANVVTLWSWTRSVELRCIAAILTVQDVDGCY
jgi:hypothetical protein